MASRAVDCACVLEDGTWTGGIRDGTVFRLDFGRIQFLRGNSRTQEYTSAIEATRKDYFRQSISRRDNNSGHWSVTASLSEKAYARGLHNNVVEQQRKIQP